MDAKLIEKLVSQEIRDGYDFNRQGIITSPGKFEGETIATLYYYECFMNGDSTIMSVNQDEHEAFDIDASYVYLAESSDGFVSLHYFDFEEDAEKYRDDVEGFEDEDDIFFVDENPSCPICNGDSYPLGVLGSISYYRCENCGMDFKE